MYKQEDSTRRQPYPKHDRRFIIKKIIWVLMSHECVGSNIKKMKSFDIKTENIIS